MVSRCLFGLALVATASCAQTLSESLPGSDAAPVDASTVTVDAADASCQLVTAVTWEGVVGTTVSNQNTLTKVGGNELWDSGAYSLQAIPSTAGYVEVTASENYTARMFGLSNGNTDSGYADIDFAIMLASNPPGSPYCVQVYEKGVQKGNYGTYDPGDVLRVQVVGDTITYLRNGVVFYTSTQAPTYPLLVDTTLNTPGATLSNAVIAVPCGP